MASATDGQFCHCSVKTALDIAEANEYALSLSDLSTGTDIWIW